MITSSSNAKIKWLQSLLKKSKNRKEEKLFTIEGIRLFQETPKELIQEIYVAESAENNLQSRLSGLKYEVVSDNIFAMISDTKTPQGILAVVKQPQHTLQEILKEKALLLILEDLQDPGNLGTIMRTAEGAGVDGILMTKGCVDIYNPKVVRSTMGSIYRMPFVYLEDEEQFLEVFRQLKEKQITTYGAALMESKDYCEYSYKKGTAFVIGNEGNGLSERALGLCERYVRIPMCGQLESLNAAMAAGILVYEAFRQRKSEKSTDL